MKTFKLTMALLLLFGATFTFTSCSDDDDAMVQDEPETTLTFTKADGADWTLAENQDRITDNVWLTRRDVQGLFNIAAENSYSGSFSPADTEWAFGTTADIDNLTFSNWEDTIDSEPIENMLNQDMVVHLISDDIYLNIKFTSWTTGNSNPRGGFSYVRSVVSN